MPVAPPPTRSRTSVRYGVDERNRLLIRTDDPLRPERVVDGAWTLTGRRELAFVFREGPANRSKTLYVKGILAQAHARSLVFTLRRGEGDSAVTQRLSLSGRWQADDANRLTFLVEKADGSADRLTLQGGWEVGPHHELVYRYARPARGGRGGISTLVFDGSWDITRSDRIVYRLSGASDSAFEFRASLQSPSLIARDGRIVYQVGIGLAKGRTQQRRVTLFGTWKLRRDLSVSFEIPYAEGRFHAVRFEAAYAPGARHQLSVQLLNSRRQPVGLTVTFTRQLAPDAGLWLRLRREAGERSVLGGVRVRF